MTGYMAKFLYLHFVDFLKVLYFIHGWLCYETSSFVRTLRDLMH